MTTIAVTLIATAFAIEIAAICVLIALDGSTKKSREAADWQRIKGMFAEEREELTEPIPMPVRQTPTDLQAAYEPPQRRVPAELILREAQQAAVTEAWRSGTYAPRHTKPTGAITQEFDRIVAFQPGVEVYAIGDRSRLEQRRAA